jgi:hypothetical protein
LGEKVIVYFGQTFENLKNWGGATFSPWLSMFINFDKNGLGNILGDFFTNPFGHPEHDT